MYVKMWRRGIVLLPENKQGLELSVTSFKNKINKYQSKIAVGGERMGFICRSKGSATLSSSAATAIVSVHDSRPKHEDTNQTFCVCQ